MKKTVIFSVLVISILTLSGCGPSKKTHSVNERRQLIDTMADESLERLFLERPTARQEFNEAAGYGVFSNTNVYVIFASGGGGYGVVVDKQTGRQTYMRQGSGGLGIGLGAKEYRQIVLFKTRQALIAFVGSGWDVGGQADATAKTNQSGGAFAADGTISKDVSVYTLTEAGLSLQATVSSSRYWVDEDLNRPSL